MSCVATERESTYLLAHICACLQQQANPIISAMSNPNNSEQAKLHAQQELSKLEGQPQISEDERHAGNVKRGLTAYAIPLTM